MKITKTIIRNHITMLGYNPNWRSDHNGYTLLDRVIARLVNDFPRDIIDQEHCQIQRDNACPPARRSIDDF